MVNPSGKVLSTVNKKEVFCAYLGLLGSRMQEIKDSIENNRKIARDAPGMMQSRSDTSKSQYSWLANAMSVRLKAMTDTIELVGKLNLEKVIVICAGAIVLVENPDYSKRIYAIVPGSESGDIELYGLKFQFISFVAPISREMFGKYAGDSFVFKGNSYDILEVI